jgi:tyrosine-protein phosphatase SIW14
MRITVTILRAASVALMLAFVSTPAVAKPEVAIGTVPAAVAPTAPALSIFNFGQVSPTYYRGGELNGEEALDLAKLGVKMVIDLRSDADYDASEAQFVDAAGIGYTRMPMTTRKAPTAEQVATFLKLVTDPANQPVYVHCVEGRHRTGVMTAVYRMTVDNWTAERAFDEMKRYKFGMDFLHPEFKKFVYAYHPQPSVVPTPATELAVATN